ncbi:MAG: sporulation protein YqfD [Clostridia bacterium]|nr:sporulation protein YqfD [Clostridia bacterium]
MRVIARGYPPERLVNKLRRKGVPLYRIRKKDKDRVSFSIEASKEQELKLACAEIGFAYTALERFDLRREGLKRIPLLLGAALFLFLTCLSNRFVFRIEVLGAKGLENKILSVLNENGLKENRAYAFGEEEKISAKVLEIEGVSYCSIRKLGTAVKVEVQLSPFQSPSFQSGDMICKTGGEIRSITVLSGTPLKGVGERVERGETLVAGYLTVEGEEEKRIPTGVIARVVIARAYEKVLQAESESGAFAKAKFEAFGVAVGGVQTIEKKEIIKTDKGYLVKMIYTVAESMNF